jgi:hypothetical protein
MPFLTYLNGVGASGELPEDQKIVAKTNGSGHSSLFLVEYENNFKFETC